MTQDEIIDMAKEAGIEEAYSLKHNQYLVRFKDGSLEAFAKLVAEKTLAEHAMRETQRLGQEIEQEPDKYLYRVDVSRRKDNTCTEHDHPIYFHSKADANNYCWTINQAPYPRNTIVVAKFVDIKIAPPPPQPEQEPVAWLDGPHLVVRSDMRDRLNYKGPWVDLGRAIPDKWTPLLFTTPPQRTEQEPVAQCTESDSWNCKYCRKTESCKALQDPRNFASPPQRTEQEPVAYDKTEMNCFVQDLYDKKMQEGKHGHYETMFHVVHQAIKRVAPPQRTEEKNT